jgi:hypothetical protein
MTFRFYDRQPEEDLFARVPEGWVITLGKRSYLVNDAQKAELLVRLVRCRSVWLVLLFVMIAPFSVMLAQLGEWQNLAALAVTTLLVYLYIFVVVPRIRLFAVRPVLAGALPAPTAPKPARVGVWNSLLKDCRRQADIFTSRYLVFAILLWGCFSIKHGYVALTSGSADYVYAVGAVLLTVNYAVVLFLKRRGGHNDSAQIG